MEELAPETVGVAASFGAAGEVTFRGHGAVIDAIAAGQVLITISEVEDLKSRVGERLTAGTPGAGNKGTIGKLLAHRWGPCGTRRCGPSAVHANTPASDRAKKIVYWRRFHAVSVEEGRTPWARSRASI